MTQEPAQSTWQQLQFDLPALTANLKRRREAAAATQMATQGRSKRVRFEAASLQVSTVVPYIKSRLCLCINEMQQLSVYVVMCVYPFDCFTLMNIIEHPCLTQ